MVLLFRHANETSEEALQKIVGSDVIIGKAYNELIEYNWTDDERAMYEWIKKNEDDNVSCLKQKFNEGIQIGQEKGREVEKIEVTKNSRPASLLML